MSADDVEIVVIDDDDEDVIQVNDAGSLQTKVKKTCPKKNVAGFSRPSYSFPMMITQALASSGKMQATALEICDLIARKYQYYRFHPKPNDWRGSVFSSLTNRKKFFVNVGLSKNNEYLWSFNPTFEKYMLNKWVPKYLRKKEQQVTVADTIIPESGTENSGVSHSIENWEHVNPVIVSCGTLKPQVDLANKFVDVATPACPTDDPEQEGDCHKKDPTWEPEIFLGGPEYVLANPEQITDSNVNVSKESDSSGLHPSDGNESGGLKAIPDVGGKPHCRDFSLENLHFRHVITNEEINYRIHFNKEHPSIQTFRLHCTVCDVHLGTAPARIKDNVRFHSNLGVLTCKACYDSTVINKQRKGNYCLWCMQPALDSYNCTQCTSIFCKACVIRNFGYSMVIDCSNGWECFFCVTKQIWPHRAIAYFLFRHYGNLKRKKSFLEKVNGSEQEDVGFWDQDQSTCCAWLTNDSPVIKASTYSTESPPVSTSNTKGCNLPILPRNLLPLTPETNPFSISSSRKMHTTNSVTVSSNENPIVSINNQFPNQVYGVPNVTLNTGTQYIHNVYPDKNYVLIQPSQSVPTSNMLPTQSTVSKPFMSIITPKLATYESDMRESPQNDPFGSTDILSSILPEQANPEHVTLSSGQRIVPGEECAPVSTNICIIRSNSQDMHIIPDNDFFPSLSDENSSVIPHSGINSNVPHTAVELPKTPADNNSIQLSIKEKITKRPMPKSKKASLLKSLLLMDKGVEAMKLKVQDSFYNASSSCNKSDSENMISESIEVDNLGAPMTQPNSVCKNVEEPILKSIIESAMERLANLQKTQTSLSSLGKSNITYETSSEVHQKIVPDDEKSENSAIPKIKIKTLQELQQSPNISPTVNEIVPNVEKQSDDQNAEITGKPKEIDITDLKQGIIEASRTLINTQKKFKELAKTISSNTSYESNQAIELINKFKNILKSCRKQIDGINKNVQNKYENFIPQYDLDSILESFKASGSSTVKNKTKGNQNETGHQIILSPWDNTDHSAQRYVYSEKSRRFVHINPLETKNILGTPEITKEDLQQFPDSTWESTMSLTKKSDSAVVTNSPLTKKSVKRNSSLNCYKKRGIWYKKKKGSIKSNNNGAADKQMRKRARSVGNELKSPVASKKARKSVNMSIPLRLSSRNHPSSAAYSAEYSSYKGEINSYLSMNYVIKPCTVVVHRLNPTIVELLQKRIN